MEGQLTPAGSNLPTSFESIRPAVAVCIWGRIVDRKQLSKEVPCSTTECKQ